MLQIPTASPLSVVMPVRNALPFLDAAVESILSQSCRDFEFVIGDDASTDGSTERLREWARRDDRIRLLVSRTPLGPAASSNWVTYAARAPIVARMDADDIAHPERLAAELEVMAGDPGIVLVGTLCRGIDPAGRIVRDADLGSLVERSLVAPFAHGSIMLRADAFRRIGGYRADCDFWEDFDLYLRLSEVGSIFVVPRPLYSYRYSDASTRLTSPRARVEESVDLMVECRRRLRDGEDYGPALARRRPGRAASKLHPDVFVSLGSIVLWAGKRPSALRQLLRRGSLGPDWATARALLWAAWAAANPATLRGVMRLRLAWRNRRRWRDRDAGEPVRWQPAG